MMNIDNISNHRLIQASALHILPVLDKHKEDILLRMIASYKGGQKDFLGEVAELSLIHDLIQKIKQSERKLTNLEERQAHERSKR